uniref:F-ATPase gamma subunit n=1 Tax=Chromera velia CCMP2878 TaxID=1169474 RepID=A0A0G4F9H0_9ALVE|eukprot:Cvel_189.t1-p1 / transcript=Cvel_189.t1 / gene=Cvel_189 / organism=Chromera_velia_CCMP2878 / gene_product=ATP synthase gamma chain, putative / transcript_product=ATP synthase gamma chain, putative / location=Cvel_scaffold11:168023-174043(-) / protein_length=455 / sequence_SO=supercontig / SO=protein_coding / is_pseudo=false
MRLGALLLAGFFGLSSTFVLNPDPCSSWSRSRALLSRPTILMGKGEMYQTRDRITSVKNIGQICGAMKASAAVKVRRAQNAAVINRPFNAGIQSLIKGLLQILRNLEEPVDSEKVPLLNVRPPKTVTVIVVGGDKGLCGSYNRDAINAGRKRISALLRRGLNVKVYAVGKRVYNSLKRSPETTNNMVGYADCTTSPTAEQAGKILSEIIEDYKNGGTDRAEIVYNGIVTLDTFRPKYRTLIPLSPQGIEAAGDEIFSLVSSGGDKIGMEKKSFGAAEAADIEGLNLLQKPITVLNDLLPVFAEGQVLRCLQEGVAAELAARVRSMGTAADNSKELAKALTRSFQKMRQALITQDVAETAAGKEAVMNQIKQQEEANNDAGGRLEKAAELFNALSFDYELPPFEIVQRESEAEQTQLDLPGAKNLAAQREAVAAEAQKVRAKNRETIKKLALQSAQ